MKPGQLLMKVRQLSDEDFLNLQEEGYNIVLTPCGVIREYYGVYVIPETQQQAYLLGGVTSDLCLGLPYQYVPISDPDADISERDDVTMDKPVTEFVE